MLKNIKINARMIGSYLIIIALMIITSVVAIVMLNQVGKTMQNFYDTSFQVVNASWNGRWNATTLRANLLQATLEDDERATEEYIAAARSAFSELQRQVDILSQKYMGDANGDRSKLTTVQNDVTAMVPYVEQLYTYASNHDAERGYAYLTDVYAPVADNIRDTLGAISQDADSRALSRVTEGNNLARMATIIIVVLCVVSTVFSVIMGLAMANGIITPVNEMKRVIHEVSQGDFESIVQYHSKDELGDLADYLRSLIITIRNIITDIEVQLRSYGEGNLNARSKDEKMYVGGFHRLFIALQDVGQAVSDTMAQIDISADQVNSGGEQVSSSAQALAQGATEQASAVEELASTVTGIATQVETTASHARAAREDNQASHDQIAVCSQHMDELMSAMQDIDSKSQEISKVIKTIEDIAFQTNILALNAAVEAARAGSAGKGFAVVADEVRNLATKSQEASKSTAALIEDTVKAVNEGSRISAETEEALKDVVVRAEKVMTAVTLITEATEQQSRDVAQVSSGIDQISSVVQTNSATAEESAAASEELSGQANVLKELVGRFTLRTGPGKSSPAAPAVRVSSDDSFAARTSGDKY